MADLSLLFKKTKSATIGVMMLDASVDENHESSATPTKNEVEDGVDVTDHVKLENLKLSITGVISATPVTIFSVFTGLATTGAGQGGTALGGSFVGLGTSLATGFGANKLAGSLSGKVDGQPRTPEDCYNYLEELRIKRQPFTIVTSLRKYDNMILTSLKVPRNVKVGRSLEFTASFEQIRMVTSSIITIAKIKSAKPVNPNETAKTGKNTADQISKATEEKGKSILKGIVDLTTKTVKGWFGK